MYFKTKFYFESYVILLSNIRKEIYHILFIDYCIYLGDSGNIVDELKQQAAIVEEQDARPEWEKYMQQNEVTGAYTYTDPNDSTVYEWDQEKRGWIPKVSFSVSLLLF